ncbi:metallophosphoesterase [Bradyrhizobium barranii subsp. apii]|uniref:Metallophosphoesterase n=1 Tax=Bradyrhizobium barranii subsp. apii TaxID=2819348 RepID=A0A8T5VFI2_9BRAD|nr:metallophosphoesterase [Bradyrhizobium barranii]UPT83857.1 metallophosphoesterase [Bradyrhizobium barranii subsp. apii]
MQRLLAVISDLHISDGDLDDFDDELEAHLAGFLTDLKQRSEHVELVINGDFLDFVQASPWTGSSLESETQDGIPLCFTEQQSLNKLANIQTRHRGTFVALKDFLADGRNHLVIMPGNHDPDFFWPRVRERFAEFVGVDQGSKKLTFCLESHYHPNGMNWLHIEHGHRYDKVNSFHVNGHDRWSANEPPILKGKDGNDRLYECVGTRFLIKYLNGLDARYPYVDNVKPFSRFFHIFGASALTPGWAPLDASVSVAKMLAYAIKIAATRKEDLLTIEAPIGSDRLQLLAKWVDEATAPELEVLTRALRGSGFELPMKLVTFVATPENLELLAEYLTEHPELVSSLGEKSAALLGAQEGTLSLKEAYKVNETEDLYVGATEAAIGGVNTVIMGHTHEPHDRKVPGLTYFNTGSWTRYYRFAPEEKTRPWHILKTGSYENFPYSLRYVQVKPGEEHATMEVWRERMVT